jgi:hypothetical protein
MAVSGSVGSVGPEGGSVAYECQGLARGVSLASYYYEAGSA